MPKQTAFPDSVNLTPPVPVEIGVTDGLLWAKRTPDRPDLRFGHSPTPEPDPATLRAVVAWCAAHGVEITHGDHCKPEEGGVPADAFAVSYV